MAEYLQSTKTYKVIYPELGNRTVSEPPTKLANHNLLTSYLVSKGSGGIGVIVLFVVFCLLYFVLFSKWGTVLAQKRDFSISLILTTISNFNCSDQIL